MTFVIGLDGRFRFLYSDEAAEFASEAGKLVVRRASYVEPDAEGNWVVDLSPIGGPRCLGRWPVAQRQAALDAEARWIRENILGLPKEA